MVWSKFENFPYFILGKISQGNVFDDILQRKKSLPILQHGIFGLYEIAHFVSRLYSKTSLFSFLTKNKY